ncbi:MAG: thioredoxin [Candidatus Micrarchaeia archaeon]|jgi:thioredoxin 1
MITGTSENFDKEVLKSSVPVVVDFWASWCGPCKMLSPIVDKVSEDAAYKGKVHFAKVNVDEQPDLAGKYNIMSIPTLMIFKKGKLVDARLGAMPESELRSWVDKEALGK